MTFARARIICRAAVGEDASVMHCNDAARIPEHNIHVVLDLNDGLDTGILGRPHQDIA